MNGPLYRSWLHYKLGVMVHGPSRASIITTVEGADRRVGGSLSMRLTSPDELRDFALKCMAAAEVMENAESEAP